MAGKAQLTPQKAYQQRVKAAGGRTVNTILDPGPSRVWDEELNEVKQELGFGKGANKELLTRLVMFYREQGGAEWWKEVQKASA